MSEPPTSGATIRAVRLTPVVVPMARPLVTAGGALTSRGPSSRVAALDYRD